MNENLTNILIIGHESNATALARKLSECEGIGNIYITSDAMIDTDFYKSVDIRDDNLTELLKFVFEKNIKLTIPLSELALSSDIVSFFMANGQFVFAPCKQICDIFYNASSTKKLLYKLKAPIPKFSTYSKLSQALDYLNKSIFPVIISSAYGLNSTIDLKICPTLKVAKDTLETMFTQGDCDVIIQEYSYGESFTTYFFTDGYSILPISTVRNFKFQYPDKSGLYTQGLACYAPDYKIDKKIVSSLKKIAQGIIDDFEYKGYPYIGILGLECVYTKDNSFIVQALKPCPSPHDFRAILNILDDNILDLITSCIHGYFADEYDEIIINDYSSVSLCVYSNKDYIEICNIQNRSDIDLCNVNFVNGKLYSKVGINFTITKTSKTLSRAKKELLDELDIYDLKQFNYRKDICGRIYE